MDDDRRDEPPGPPAPSIPEAQEVTVVRFEGGRMAPCRDVVAGESPLVILLDGEVLVRLRCLPTDQEALALGFLLTEGLVEGMEEIRSVRSDTQGFEVWIEADVPGTRLTRFRKDLTLTTACGGGITSHLEPPPREAAEGRAGGPRIGPDDVLALVKELHDRSGAFQRTGSIHSAALANPGGILLFAEDVGRHNAVDKVIGLAARRRIDLEERIVVSSGRLTFEILAKLARVGVPCVISRSAPSAQALELAGEFGMTVIGFARGRRFNVYTAPWRVRENDTGQEPGGPGRPPRQG